MKSVLEMTDDELRDRVRRLPELATGLLVPPPWVERLKNAAGSVMTGRPIASFGRIRVTESPFLPDNVCVWIDSAGQVLSIMRLDQPETA